MMSSHRTTSWVAALAVAALSVTLASPASAQRARDADARWMPFVGCWQPADAGEEAMLCVVPTDQPLAVELQTWDGDNLAESTILDADGAARQVERRGCSGQERTTFSDDGHRVYIHADLDCGTGVQRTSERMLAMVASTAWLDVEALDIMGQSLAMTRRFTLASPERFAVAGQEALLQDRLALETARFAAAADFNTDDIIDAMGHVDAEGVRAWIAERGEPLRLDAKRLVAMADAGVPEDVIDVAIAVSYPQDFAVKTTPDQGMDRMGRRIPVGWDWGYSMWNPWGFSYYPYYGYYSRYGWGYPYGYGGYYGGYWGGYWGGYGTRVVVVPRQPESRGSITKGGGYRRGASGGSVGTAQPRASASRGGYSSGGGARPASSSSGTTRKAKPRGGSGHH